ETGRGLGEKLAAEYRREFVGHELDVLVEKANGKILTGTSENYLSVSFEGESGDVGRIVRVKLV
ncbi:MAG: tRNA (N(6)-L-threonylcarbamoyladenosine(37)-C(2))-methylthiotransferase MtaB, partial [Actinomycetota bacterium]